MVAPSGSCDRNSDGPHCKQLISKNDSNQVWDYVFLALSAPLIGLTLSARRLPGSTQCRTDGKTITGGGLTYLAVGCPICNKLVVALLGSSGALTYFAPVQLVLGGFAIILLLYSLREALGASFGPEVGAELQTLTSTDR